MVEAIEDASRRAAALTGEEGSPILRDPQLAFVTPQLKAALDVWRTRCGARRMPGRADMTIQELKFALPHLAFLGLVREGDRLRYKVRLMGSELDAFITPMTGRFVDEAVPARFAEKWSALWRPAIETRAPFRTAGRAEFRDRRSYVAETLYAPLADDGETVDALMIVSFYHLHDEDASPTAIANRLIGEIEQLGSAPRSR